ncbi:MAG TPA: ABC transporter ATP-binding protein [Pseudolabrys sp.]|nr:ABC transporter ATP-binding protein [Pseudolabrys sp.]
MAGVTLKGITKSYGGGGMAAVANLDLDIGDNQFVTLLGPSGCGKTTTLRLIAGYMAPDSGTIAVDGRLMSSKDTLVLPEHRGMGMVFQNYAVWPHKTVFENVVFGLKLRKVPVAKARDLVHAALAQVNLSGYEDRLPSQLSGGQQQRVALARSLVVEPDILLLDEPLSNLDAKLREHMRSELKHLQRRTGITFIYVTHDQSEALALSDMVAVIHGGKLQQFGTPQEVYSRPANRIVADFMGSVNLLPGEVSTVRNGRGDIVIAGMLPTQAALPAGADRGSQIEVAVRPESVLLAAAGKDGIRAEVTDRTFLGNLNEYQVRLGQHMLRVQTHPKETFAVGDTVGLTVDPEAISVFVRD